MDAGMREQALTLVLGLLIGVMLFVGFGSVLLGWVIDVGARIVSAFQVVMLRLPAPSKADNPDRQTDRPSVSADDLYCPRLELDRSKVAIIEVMVYNGWGTGEIRASLKGDNGAIGAEVEAARQRLGIEPPDNKTPIAQRPTDAKFAPTR